MDKGTKIGGGIGVVLGLTLGIFNPGAFGPEATIIACVFTGLLLGWFYGGMKGL